MTKLLVTYSSRIFSRINSNLAYTMDNETPSYFTISISNGVCQGVILSPTRFVIYIHVYTCIYMIFLCYFLIVV